MSEPIYEFVKGKGWILQEPVECFFCQDRKGKTIKVINRCPQNGEIYFGCSYDVENLTCYMKDCDVSTFVTVGSETGIRADIADMSGYITLEIL